MGKMLLLSFENSEDDVISEILSILENKQMKICENKRLFRGNGGLKTSTTPVFIPIRRHSTFG